MKESPTHPLPPFFFWQLVVCKQISFVRVPYNIPDKISADSIISGHLSSSASVSCDSSPSLLVEYCFKASMPKCLPWQQLLIGVFFSEPILHFWCHEGLRG